MNVTPDSFSDGGELTAATFQSKLTSFGPVDALDIGAESTAPMNAPISPAEEWNRLAPILPLLKDLNCPLSLDTYHPETIFRIANDCKGTLIWNDVSGKFDDSVIDFLKLNEKFHYVFCHNRAPSRKLTATHMQYLSESQGDAFMDELTAFFLPHIHPRVIFDPCLGFSKTYEQNWYILDHFADLQRRIPHNRWLLGLSRKSFLRKKYNLSLDAKDVLDTQHVQEIKRLIPSLKGEVWIRTHRPEIL
ncbi:MAG TPA: dihydropteroate synthase [Bacteriovoracaceae bacterium]|nr:dihydropteroate synthase [Bacteriovoracaceae bacterium]